MKHDEPNIQKVLASYLGRHGDPSPDHVDSAVERVRQKLNPEVARMPSRPALEFHARRAWQLPLAAAAVVFVVLAVIASAVLVRNVIPGKPANVIAELSDGQLSQTGRYIYPNERLGSGAGGALIALDDSSRVEVRAQSELMFERAGDGVRIRLYKGDVIVTAAKRRAGHLYVETKDVTVSVMGTVFLVNTEAEGSRVAVIQGEVRVQQNATAKKLIPGQQVATGPAMELRPMSEEISWSRHAEEHLALLHESALPVPTVTQSARRLEFSAVSIKPLTEDGMKALLDEGGAAGLACHGIDGISRAAFGVTAGAGALAVPLGGCAGVFVDLAWLITYAYETPWRYGPNVPDWARSGELSLQPEYFLIEAAAGDPTTATVAQLRQMLQAMLADRFKLKAHRETQEVQGYALVVAPNGPKLKAASGELEPPHYSYSPNGIRGKSSLDELTQFLPQYVMLFANLGFLEGPFINKTGLTGIYEYEFRRPCPTVGPRGGCVPSGGNRARGQLPPPERAADKLAALSDGMEAQLGIRLQPEKMQADLIVIDQVEKPAPN